MLVFFYHFHDFQRGIPLPPLHHNDITPTPPPEAVSTEEAQRCQRESVVVLSDCRPSLLPDAAASSALLQRLTAVLDDFPEVLEIQVNIFSAVEHICALETVEVGRGVCVCVCGGSVGGNSYYLITACTCTCTCSLFESASILSLAVEQIYFCSHSVSVLYIYTHHV